MPQDDLADARLEREIADAKQQFDAAIGSPDALRAAWANLSTLVKQRSDTQIERMEHDLGLGGQV